MKQYFLVGFDKELFKEMQDYVEKNGCGSNLTGLINEACRRFLEDKEAKQQ